MKFAFCIFILFVSLKSYSQEFTNQWAALLSYVEVVDLAEGNDRLFAASENALFTYDLITGEINTINTINGLSGDLISKVYYSESFDIILIGYQNGLMELVLEDGAILTVVDILNKPTIPPNKKRINHFNEFNGNIYIATDYGISVFDLTGLEFGDTYFIGDFGAQDEVNQTAVIDGFIYAAMDNRMKRADVNNPNLIDFEQWLDFYPFGLLGVQAFGNFLYAIDFNSRLLRFEGNNATVVTVFPQANRNIYTSDDFLTVTSLNRSTVFDLEMSQVASVNNVMDFEFTLSNSLAYNDAIYLGTREHGVLEVPFGANQAEQILPEGPLLNKPFALDATPGQLWTVFGEVNLFFNPYPLNPNRRGVSQFENNMWTNIPYEEVFDAVAITHVKINPSNPSEVYASSMFSGLLKFVDKVPVTLLNETNSALEGAFTDNSIRLFGSEFDREGNLWFVQSGAEDGLKRMSTSGQIQGFDFTSVIPEPTDETGLNKLDITREGNVFFASSRNGLIGYNTATSQFKKIGENIGNGNLPSTNVRAVAVDNRNQIWIGTLRGLRVLFNVAGFFEEDANVDAQPIIILDNDGVAQELLFEQSITDIEVDGANNKWIATSSSGVFYVSPNGQETLLRFNKDNSPLPSNNILDVAIDPQSGVVYFATRNGLMAYNGSTTAPNETLENLRAFPNPVRPGFNGNVTIDGLTARANVKITDLNGNLVFEEVSEGGSVLWDTSAFGKYKVASGVYFIMVTTDDASETNISKLMIVR
tara:strand:- start:81475 stop:83751 length:2277 start_codon:yes stop_codon:yes gene_type:complete